MTKHKPTKTDLTDGLTELEDHIFLTILEFQHIVWTPFSLAAKLFKEPATITQAKRRIRLINYSLTQLVRKKKVARTEKEDGEWVYAAPVKRGF